MLRINKWWLVWLAFTLLLSAYYTNALVGSEKNKFLPGKATDGHYQIEDKCDTCHGDGFDDKETLQKSCVRCHGDELKKVNDSHPKSKFTNPRNADRIAILDARYCVTCHVEHKTEKTLPMGVTMPEDYCYLCHQDVAKNRPSHKGMGFETCDDAGCHNYHDNKALYEEFLVKHNGEPENLQTMMLPEKNLKTVFHQKNEKYKQVLTPKDMNNPESVTVSPKISYQWHSTAHAKSGVNCSSCHNEKEHWIFKPNQKVCAECHEKETDGFLASRHGMRTGEGLPAMKVGEARLSLRGTAANKVLNCQSCHTDHSFNTEKAAVDACLGCHEDDHSKAYKKSKHYRAMLEAKSTKTNKQGVTCANCHMPRLTIRENGVDRTLVDHNQNNTLRPNEKMARTVCMKCHGLKFSLESLADTNLINNNFEGSPSLENKGFAMVMEREELKRKGLIKDDKK